LKRETHQVSPIQVEKVERVVNDRVSGPMVKRLERWTPVRIEGDDFPVQEHGTSGNPLYSPLTPG
jgi:hypothetical protein